MGLVEVVGRAGVTSPTTVVDALLSISAYSISHNVTMANVARDISTALGAEGGSADLTEILKGRGLVAIAKTYELASSYARYVHTIRLITDLRPVFGAEVDDAPVNMVISHQLEMLLWESGDVISEYVTLDDEDLEELDRQVSRAKAKAATLRKTMGRLGIPVFEPGGDAP